ncbi:MAG: non-canonical purine NTP pyrophosphatase [Planctomycetota bacterium]|nr:non-canonical purine NTP pyrophosphatase [Planctomycetota bacterium]
MRILVATSNPHKVEEIRAILDAERRAAAASLGPAIELVDLREIPNPPVEPVEDQTTFEGNATLKARYYAKATGMLALADDSGLEVDALGGAPGVISANYAGIKGPRNVVDPANNRLLLERLADVPAEKRTGRFVCTMALCGPKAMVAAMGLRPRAGETDLDWPIVAVTRGTVEGRILTPQETADPSQPHRGRGCHGFGYDPLFLIAEAGSTTAELEPAQKNAISHRGRATRLLWKALRGN